MLTKNILARVSATLILAALASPAIGCAAPTASDTSSNDGASSIENAQGDVAEKLSETVVGAELMNGKGVVGSDFGGARAIVSTELVLSDKAGAIALTSYSFGVTADVNVVSATADVGGGKANVLPLSISAPSKATTAALSANLFTGDSFPKIILRQRITDTKGKTSLKTLATFEHVIVTQVTTSVDQDSQDTAELAVGKVTVTQGNATVAVDRLTNTSSCNADSTIPCPCIDAAGAPVLPSYALDGQGILPKGAVPFISTSFGVQNNTNLGSVSGGADTGKATLESISMTAMAEQSGVCAMFQAARGRHVPVLHFDRLSGPDAKGFGVITQSWDACVAAVSSVAFSGNGEESPSETIDFIAAGLVRTDFDSITQKPSAVTGWSFSQNKAIMSCK